ncbi:YggS family pyridoxal phosphate-dependent enzyme [Actinomycetaceae bacterium WB03_NA08]|uniref:Pyridoxal phosphate homeostasis protein n=1 Tax=Scrofimicrobium canadense TaxID=2652290 RepID=A0A6N7W5T7_9ACTO|nr:YggS family pyridoxal phosphate-dependent enzyme [Scrofimicrobium canadense]MSS84675.1 YggS family pyridoxal phosphate-dependent enzyme [Scrofimicrobium canadense]
MSNLHTVLENISRAAQAAGRSPDEITLLPVTKYYDLAQIQELIDAGVTRMGENRPQQLAERAQLFPQINWVMIGRLQTNKAGLIARYASECQSVDSVRLARALDRRLDRALPILLQVNISGEESKTGFAPQQVPEALEVAEGLEHLDVRGFMTMAPHSDDPTVARETFRKLRELRDKVAPTLPELSMGMSGDFPQAIAEGATIVRVGSALF